MSFLTVNYQRLPFFFFFNDTATTEIYTLSLHDALPISCADALDIIPAWPILLWSAVLPLSSQPSRILRGTLPSSASLTGSPRSASLHCSSAESKSSSPTRASIGAKPATYTLLHCSNCRSRRRGHRCKLA